MHGTCSYFLSINTIPPTQNKNHRKRKGTKNQQYIGTPSNICILTHKIRDRHVSIDVADQKPHALCIPLPYQGHIRPLLKFAKLLHHRGFRITFVNITYNHIRFLKSLGHDTLDGLTDSF
ncbi:hypothetical protein PRUPE_3G189800 [Prunus persica]|uniref:Uncharacterized protein n=1 Tax=Prunus persica TaxID=3760 RepID=A0A251Q2M4_PRUPE|nr:hypothetical protein PRUPE_3G189800 [Prunus persica]